MCHGNKMRCFPEPDSIRPFTGDGLHGFLIGEGDRPGLVILPDIYGCTPFYQGFAAHFAARGLTVLLLNPFHEFGALSEMTREAAFNRRHKVRDKAYVDALDAFLARNRIGGVVGFCVGGLYVFDLARRGYRGRLVALYPFPQGLPNQDPLPVPFDYLPDTPIRHTVLIGDSDTGLGSDNTRRMQDQAAANPAIDLRVFTGSGHGFLADLDGDDLHRQRNAQAALACVETVVGTCPALGA